MELYELTNAQLGQLARHGNTPEIQQAAQAELDARNAEEADRASRRQRAAEARAKKQENAK